MEGIADPLSSLPMSGTGDDQVIKIVAHAAFNETEIMSRTNENPWALVRTAPTCHPNRIFVFINAFRAEPQKSYASDF